MKFVVRKSVLNDLGNILDAETIEKARKGEQAANHKYIFRKPTGKTERPYEYIFIEDLIKRPMKMIKDFFGITEKQIEQVYEKLDIKKDYGATLTDLQQHLLEYFCHRDIWDKRFADKNIRDKNKKPVIMVNSKKIIDKTTETPKPVPMQQSLFDDLEENEAETWKANPTLMRKIWGIYTGSEIDRQENNEKKVIEKVENAKVEPEKKEISKEDRDAIIRQIRDFKNFGYSKEKIKNAFETDPMLKNTSYFADNMDVVYAEIDNAFKDEPKETEQEKHDNRSKAMRGNQNARKYELTEETYNKILDQFKDREEIGIFTVSEYLDNLENYDNSTPEKKLLSEIERAASDKGLDRQTFVVRVYNESKGDKNNGENQNNLESTGISGGSENLRNTSGPNSYENVSGSENGSNGTELQGDTLQSGIGSEITEGIDYDYFRQFGDGSGRLTDTQALKIREACRKILETKTDEQMTEADKAVLSLYVGAGGNKKEKNKSDKAILSEFYTPRKIVNKIWQLVDKYIPQQDKTCIEPSSGIGRFAEGRKEKFTMFEYEPVSARIAKILHPEAEVVQGEFEKNWILDGRFNQKNIAQFDCCVGNPPYMNHSGIYAGRGVGKEFTRAEGFFISSSLKTLKENGVLAMVVPSGMLNSNGKNGTYGADMLEIAKQCELLEAWRLPQDSFDSTAIGTDIIVLRKKTGGSNPEDFINGNYFKKNPTHVCGDIVKEKNQWGDLVDVVRPHNGDTTDSAIDLVNVNDIEAIIKELPKAETNIVDNTERNKKISDALKGNKNAAGKHHFVESTGRNLSATEFNQKYGKQFDPKDIEIWKNTDWNGNIDITKLSDEQKSYIEKSDHFIKEGDNYINVVNYASGNLKNKLNDLEAKKEAGIITENDYEFRKSLLNAALPAQKELGQFNLSPIADWTIKYKTKDGHSLINGFMDWAFNGRINKENELPIDSPIAPEEIPPDCTFGDIMGYINKIPLRVSVKDGENKADRKRVQFRRAEGRRDTAEKLFNRYLQEGLSLDDQKDLTDNWNTNFNSFVNPDYTKIPVFIDGMNEKMGNMDFTLTPQQIKGITFLINKGAGLLAYDVGVGKALANSEKVLTPNGWVENGSLKVGDYVIGDDGKPAQIENVYPQGIQDIYEVTFSDGAKVRCTKEHLWNVQLPYMRNRAQSKNKNKFNTVELQSFMNKLHNARGERKYSIPMCKPIEFEKKDLLIDPYLMGVLLGDGSFKINSIGITSEDEFILDKIKPMLQNCELKYAGSYDYRISYPYIDVNKKIYNPIVQAIKKYGLENHKSINKFIPQDYLFSSVDDRIELLRGLLDTDGYVKKDGTTTIYYSISENLVRDIRQLVMSLGGTVSITEKIGKYKKNNEIVECKKCYVVTIKLDMINPFSLPRKADLYVNKTKYKPVRYIDSVELIGKEEASCIWINNKSHLYITNDYVVTHNTVTGICATVNQIQTGRAKRPLICVPNAVYENWYAEIKQHFPDMKINELKNLGNGYMPGKDWKPEEGTITLCTYEALEKMTFHDETLSEIHEDVEFAQLQTSEKPKSDRKRAQENEKIDELVGSMTKTGNDYAFFDDMGFDHITVDEIHNFKNIFTTPSKLDGIETEEGKKAESNEFRGLSGSKSDRGEKLFAITQYIQRHNNNRNVFGLSATPFQNSPIEIYNILSLFARQRLKELGIYSLQEFVKQFALLKSEYVVTATEIKEKMVMKSFNNLGALQNLITEYIDKVDGGEAHVIRPRKRTHLPRLEMTDVQRQIMQAEAAYIEQQSKLPKAERDPGSTLNSLNAMRMATLAPGLVSDERYAMYASMGFNIKKPSDKEFVESSPKLKFVCESVIQAYKNNNQHGQVIYMPRGVTKFPLVTEYLVKHGVPKDAIIEMAGGDSGSEKKSVEREDKIHEFNDVNGKAKIIIGSENIKEGVNLNGNSTVLYNTMLGWNPTETTQVEGRIWRQGNKQGITHIVYPLLNDSIDPMMYQKYDEKKSRIDNLFSFKGDQMNVEEIDPEELKFGLIKDPLKRADLKAKQEKEKAEGDQRLYAQMIDVLHKQIKVAFNDVENTKEYQDLKKKIDGVTNIVKVYSEQKKTVMTKLQVAEAANDTKTAAQLKRQADGIQVYIDTQNRLVEKTKKDIKKLEGTKKSVLGYLEKRGIHTKDQAENKIMEYTKLMDEARDRGQKADELKEQYYKEALEENEKNKYLIPTMEESISSNVKEITTDLHPMDEEYKAILTAENEAEDAKKGIKKSLFVIENGRLYVRRFVKKSDVETVII